MSAVSTTGVIHDATLKCRNSLQACLSIDTLAEEDWAENRLADFNLWTSGIGALAYKRASLDARLALRPNIRDAVENLLLAFDIAVQECIKQGHETQYEETPISDGEEREERSSAPGQPYSGSFSPWSSGSSISSLSDPTSRDFSNSQLAKAMKDVDSMLDQLARLAVTIRRSGARSRLQKADSSFDCQEHQELRDHLIIVLQSQRSDIRNFTFSPDVVNMSTLDTVQQRLINHNLRRRHRFLYAQRHAQALHVSSNQLFYTRQVKRMEDTRNEHDIYDRLVEAQETRSNRSEGTAKAITERGYEVNTSMKIGTTASGVTTLPEAVSIPEASQAASTQLSTTAIGLDYPLPPKIAPGALVFQCPCCCQVLPAFYSEEDRWKKHLAEDISPYSCVLPNCSSPDQLFVRKQAWKDHLLERHVSQDVWICYACLDHIEFQQEAEFTTHLAQSHSDTIPANSMSAFQSACRKPMSTNIESCPVCSSLPSSENHVDRTTLTNHVAEHVHAFSLLSLPWPPDHTIESNLWMEYGRSKVQRWLEQHDLVLPDSQDVPFLSNKNSQLEPAPGIHYFDSHEFFAEQAKSRSGLAASENTMGQELTRLQDEVSLSFTESVTELDVQEPARDPVARSIDESFYVSIESQHDQGLPSGGNKYMPAGALRVSITADRIASYLLQASGLDYEERSDTELVDFIVNKANKIFAALLMMEMEKCNIYKLMKVCQKTNISNENLPLRKDPQGHIDNAELMAVSEWTDLESDIFYRWQWRFLAPVLDRSVFLYSFPEKDVILPWKGKNEKIYYGFFHYVYRYEIHRHHLGNSLLSKNGGGNVVAVKKIPTDRVLSIESLSEFRKRISSLFNPIWKHHHLLSCIAAIEHGTTFYLLFPWTGRTLHNFWGNMRTPILERKFFIEMIEQLYGVATALEHLHEHGCWHGSLNPHCIFITAKSDDNSIGLLKMGGFEAPLLRGTHMSHEDRRYPGGALEEHVAGIRGEYISAKYQAPEQHLRPAFLKWAYSDLWGMGCVFLEMLIWMIYGYQSLSDMSKSAGEEQTTPSVFSYHRVKMTPERKRIANLHPLAVYYINLMHREEDVVPGKTALGDLLDLVQNKLLIPETPPGANGYVIRDNGKYRTNTKILRDSMATILEKSKRNPDYLPGTNIRRTLPQLVIRHR